jgi:hypothetical protein
MRIRRVLTYFNWRGDIRLTAARRPTDANGVPLLIPCERAAVAGDAAKSPALREDRESS